MEQWTPIPRKLHRYCLKRSELIAGINLAGTIFGIYYYLPQLSATEPLIWIFVADSPIATALFATALLLQERRTKSDLLNSLAFIGNTKYGLWTVAVLLLLNQSFLNQVSIPMYLFLLVSHVGMTVQAFLLETPEFGANIFAGPVFYLFNDAVDYTWAVVYPAHTLLPNQELIAGNYTHTQFHPNSAFIAFSLTVTFTTLLMIGNRIKN